MDGILNKYPTEYVFSFRAVTVGDIAENIPLVHACVPFILRIINDELIYVSIFQEKLHRPNKILFGSFFLPVVF